MKNLNIAIVGAGFIANYHVKGLAALENVEVTTVCAIPLSSAKDFAKKYGVKNTSDDAADLAKNPDIDGVVLALPNYLHAEFAVEFLRNGKDVFIEKPLAMNQTEVDSIRNASLESGRIVMTGHMWRFDEDMNHIKMLVESGVLGRIYKTKGYGIHEDWGPKGWFVKKELSGGGALIDMGVHAIDAARYLLGDPLPVSVFAELGTHFGKYDVDDSGIIIVNWDNGATSIIESGWWQPHSDGPEAATRLFGTEGFASVFPTNYKLKKDGFKEVNPELTIRDDHCSQVIYNMEMEHFVKCIRDRSVPLSGISEGQVVMQIVDAAYRSSETNSVISI